MTYTDPVTCKVLIVGLMLFAVFVPLAALPPVIFVLDAPVAATVLAAPVTATLSTAVSLAATLVRGPPPSAR